MKASKKNIFGESFDGLGRLQKRNNEQEKKNSRFCQLSNFTEQIQQWCKFYDEMIFVVEVGNEKFYLFQFLCLTSNH